DDDDQEDEGDDDKDDEKKGGDDEQASNEEEFIHPSPSTHTEEEPKDEESFDPIPKKPKDTDDEGNGEENLDINVGREEGKYEEEEEDELYRHVNINQERVAPLPMSAPTITPSTITTITTTQQAPLPPTIAPSTLLQDLPNFGLLFGFDHRLKTLEENFSEFSQTNQFAGASDLLRDEAQADNDKFLKTDDENMQKIIKEQVKEQVKVQVSKILPKIEHTMNEQLEAEVLTRSSNSSKTSYAIAADLTEMELKKILIEKMEGNKDTITLKRRCNDDADRDEEPFAGSDRGSKRRKEGKEPESASAPIEKATRSAGKVDTLTPDLLAGPIYELMKGSCKSLVELEYQLEEVYKPTTDQLDWVNPKEVPRAASILLLSPRRSDGTLNDVRTALDDRLKGIQMQYLPQSI
nr:hypothetical protein [Tanacetum cinerariifolium]